jgi:hypothetical protein
MEFFKNFQSQIFVQIIITILFIFAHWENFEIHIGPMKLHVPLSCFKDIRGQSGAFDPIGTHWTNATRFGYVSQFNMSLLHRSYLILAFIVLKVSIFKIALKIAEFRQMFKTSLKSLVCWESLKNEN